ncbi:hypothetical protein ENKNEFLB_00257 [Nocardioides aquaticus]|uniref:Iron-binding zinc finger CDGSH type domain-containing protein n=1 Tax=Nocardioides aquaticus TaxID=160826 RepID=A0ABX8EFL4_9ACTN|nr:hypothetical protein ENKNEFLB_00257 [Nocardioides aquaticus]
MTRPAPEPTARVVEGDPVRLPCAGGPLLLRGAAVVETSDGVRHATTRPVSALCRCGRSSIAPWCDATHKLLPAADRPT